MNRTDFLKNAFEYFFENDDLKNMRYFFKDPFYFKKIEDGFTKDTSNDVASTFNQFFKANDINKELSEIEALYFCQPRLKEIYSGVGIVVDFNHLYDELLEDKIIEPSNTKEIMYRIENSKGVGFYSHFSDKGCGLSDKVDMDVPNTPPPMTDGLLVLLYGSRENRSDSSDYVFGFESKEQAALWITEEERVVDHIILDDDLYFSEYEINPAYTVKGNKQIVSHQDHIKLKNRVQLQEALKGQKELLIYKEKLEQNEFSEKEKNEITSFLKNKDGTVDVKKIKRRKNKKREQNNNDKQLPLF